jgi:hypothetical protein
MSAVSKNRWEEKLQVGSVRPVRLLVKANAKAATNTNNGGHT